MLSNIEMNFNPTLIQTNYPKKFISKNIRTVPSNRQNNATRAKHTQNINTAIFIFLSEVMMFAMRSHSYSVLPRQSRKCHQKRFI